MHKICRKINLFLQALPPGVVMLAHWILGTYYYIFVCLYVISKLIFVMRKRKATFLNLNLFFANNVSAFCRPVQPDRTHCVAEWVDHVESMVSKFYILSIKKH